MIESRRDIDAATEPEGFGFWSKYECFIGSFALLTLALPIWLIGFPESYERAVDCVADAGIALGIIAIAATFVNGIVRSPKTDRAVRNMIAPAVSFGVAILAAWNCVALYTNAGLRPITLVGWELSARPLFYLLTVVIMLVAAVRIEKWLGRGEQIPISKSTRILSRPSSFTPTFSHLSVRPLTMIHSAFH